MKGTVVDGAVAEEGHGDVIASLQLETVARAGRLENARADDAAGAHHAGFGSEEVHAAAAPLGTAGCAPRSSAKSSRGVTPLASACP